MTRRRHRPEGGPGDEFADFVRRSLHSAAEHVEPSPDGLDRIRDKIRSGPAYASATDPEPGAGPGRWGWGVLAGLVRRLSGGRGEHTAPRGHGAAPRPGRASGRGAGPGHARPAQRRATDWREAMLRPALAIGVAVFALAVVLAAVPPLRHFVQASADLVAGSSSSTPTSPGIGRTGQGSSGNGVEGTASLGITSPSAVPCLSPTQSTQSTQSHASGSPKVSTSSPTRSTAPTIAPTSPSVTASPNTASPSQSATASPSDTVSASASPNGSAATSSASASPTGTASASDSASAKASTSASASPHASTSRRAATQTPTPTPAASCGGEAAVGGTSASPSKSAHATTSPSPASPTVTPDPSPSVPDTSGGNGINPYGGSPNLSGGSPP